MMQMIILYNELTAGGENKRLLKLI